MKTKRKFTALERYISTLPNSRLIEREAELTAKLHESGNSEIEMGLIRQELQTIRSTMKFKGVSF